MTEYKKAEDLYKTKKVEKAKSLERQILEDIEMGSPNFHNVKQVESKDFWDEQELDGEWSDE